MGRRRGDHLVAEGANPIGEQAADVHVGRGDERTGSSHGPVLELPRTAAAVEELGPVVAAQLEHPIGMGGEPVVIPAVQHDGAAPAHAAGSQQAREVALGQRVAAIGRVQVRAARPRDGAGDMSSLVLVRVPSHLDHVESVVAEPLRKPRRFDERGIWIRHVGAALHRQPPSPMRKAAASAAASSVLVSSCCPSLQWSGQLPATDATGGSAKGQRLSEHRPSVPHDRHIGASLLRLAATVAWEDARRRPGGVGAMRYRRPRHAWPG